MNTIAWKVSKLRGMAQGEVPVDDAFFKKSAHDVATLAGMLADGFIPNSIVKGSLALPDIWKNFSDFQQKANDLQTAATALAERDQEMASRPRRAWCRPWANRAAGAIGRIASAG